MSIMGRLLGHHRTAFPTLVTAADRHILWASDFAAVGDLESALAALRDYHALCGELSTTASAHPHDGSEGVA
jgi:hypothetical protein